MKSFDNRETCMQTHPKTDKRAIYEKITKEVKKACKNYRATQYERFMS